MSGDGPDLRLAAPAAAMWLAAGLGVGMPLEGASGPLWWAAGGCALVCAVLVCLMLLMQRRETARHAAGRRRRLRAVSFAAVAALGAGLGCAATAAATPGRTSAVLASAARAREEVTVDVRVDTSARRVASGFGGEARWRWRGTVVRVAVGGAEVAGLAVPVTVTSEGREALGAAGTAAGPRDDARRVTASVVAPTSKDALVIGSVLHLHGFLTPEPPGEPTSFRLRAGDGGHVVDPPPFWLSWASPVRQAFADAAARTPGDGGALLPGLAIGDETAVPVALDTAMKESSLSHLTAVSGANCALVTGLVLLGASSLGLGRRTRVVIAGCALAAFVVLVGPSPSVVRAAAMAVVVLLALIRGRPVDALPTLALAVIVLLLHDPWLSRDYGFALSVLATAGLLLFAAPLARALSRWMPRPLAFVLAVPAAAQLACQPVLLLLSPTIPLYGVLANLLAEPAAPIATALGCVACLLLPWAPALGQAAVWLAWAPAGWIAEVARVASALPGHALPWPDGSLGVLLCVGLASALVLVCVRHQLPRAVGVTAAAAILCAVVAYAGTLGGGAIGRVVARPGDWAVAACDVGQGDALLLRDGDEVAMIDVGREPEPATACLDRLGIGRLALLVLTHYDADHVGGLAGVVDRAKRVLVGPAVRDADEAILSRLDAAGVPVEQGTAGMSGALGSTRWRLLWPPSAPARPGEPASGGPTGNEGSIVVAADGHGLRTLFLGDLDERAQDRLLATGAIQPVDVVKVAHHGSADQSPSFYAAIHARLGLVSVGADNGYGHPTRRALHMLAEAGTAVARTDQQGLLLVSPGDGGPRLWSERPAAVSSPAAASAPAAVPTPATVSTPAAELMPAAVSTPAPWPQSRPPRNLDAAHAAARTARAATDGGPPYPGCGRGGTWRPETPAVPARAEAAAAEAAQRARRARSRSCPGTAFGRRPWSSSPGRRASSPTGPRGCYATSSRPPIRVSRSATSPPPTTRRGSCSRSRAPPCSGSHG